jgi:hypothetical protein
MGLAAGDSGPPNTADEKPHRLPPAHPQRGYAPRRADSATATTGRSSTGRCGSPRVGRRSFPSRQSLSPFGGRSSRCDHQERQCKHPDGLPWVPPDQTKAQDHGPQHEPGWGTTGVERHGHWLNSKAAMIPREARSRASVKMYRRPRADQLADDHHVRRPATQSWLDCCHDTVGRRTSLSSGAVLPTSFASGWGGYRRPFPSGPVPDQLYRKMYRAPRGEGLLYSYPKSSVILHLSCRFLGIPISASPHIVKLVYLTQASSDQSAGEVLRSENADRVASVIAIEDGNPAPRECRARRNGRHLCRRAFGRRLPQRRRDLPSGVM